jgi:RNA polymerase sigma factor (sigma-70 family)
MNQNLFTEIYSEYRDKIYNLAFRMTGDGAAADDITQETFILVYKKYSTFKGRSSLYTWIYAITKNLCFQHLKNVKRGRFQSLENLIHSHNSPAIQSGYSPDEKQFYIKQVKEGCLLGLLRCLSLYQRISFILAILNNLTIPEISKIIGKSPNSTRILIHRARKNLKSFLCKNCSLYDNKNPCKCEDLIDFSLKNNWISNKSDILNLHTIESELSDLKSEILLYKSLTEQSIPEERTKKLAEFIERQPFKIFFKKIVK